MYSLNGVALHDQTRGWRILRAGTNTKLGISNRLNQVPAPGRNGYVPAPKTFSEQMFVFVVRTTLAGLEPLLTLCAAATELTLDDDLTKEARVELASAMPESDSPLDAMQDVTITLIAYEGVWRDVSAVTEGPTSITTPSQSLTMLTGLSGPIADMDVFIRGDFGQFTLLDSGGSWLKTTQAWVGSSSTGIFFSGITGQAFLANESSPWTPVSDVSQYVDVSGNGGFQLTPKMVSGNPASRRVELTLTTLSQTSTTLRVRAKRAYRIN